jgi:signal transduction histidine kinase
MSSIVGNSLDIARIESGKIELVDVPVSLRDLLAKVVVAFPEGSREPGVELITTIDSGCPEEVLGDMTRLLQILMNLVGNALKFTSVGHVKVSVHAEALAAEKYLLRFIVDDTGPGISHDMIQKIFEPFVRNGTLQKRGPSGTGLGLTIARELARLMGGDVTATSEVGKGSSFVVSVRVQAVR